MGGGRGAENERIDMRTFKVTVVLLFIFVAYIAALVYIARLPKRYADIFETRAVLVLIATNIFGAIIAILIAMKVFNVVKGQISEFYSEIKHLKQDKLVMDKEKMKELGMSSGHLSRSDAVMRYPAGCIKRERERLARIFAEKKTPDKVAAAIVDDSLDDKVFKWNGPETPLDAAPVSHEDREREKKHNGGKTS